MRETVCSEPECRAPLVPDGQPVAPLFAQRPFTNLCFVCAAAIYIERLASFALKGPPPAPKQISAREFLSETWTEAQRRAAEHSAQYRAWIQAQTELQRKVEEERRRMNP